MTSQYDFSNDDWNHVATTPVLVGFAVALAEDSGVFGSWRELRTLNNTIAEGFEDDSANSLISQAAATDTSDKTEAYKAISAEALAETAVLACERLNDILSSKAEPDESAGYKRWVLRIANAVAEAASEHGDRVSPGEAALIERLHASLAID